MAAFLSIPVNHIRLISGPQSNEQFSKPQRKEQFWNRLVPSEKIIVQPAYRFLAQWVCEKLTTTTPKRRGIGNPVPMRLDTAWNWRSSLRASKKDDKKINAYLLMYHVILTDCTITTRDFSRKGQNLQSWIASFKSRPTGISRKQGFQNSSSWGRRSWEEDGVPSSPSSGEIPLRASSLVMNSSEQILSITSVREYRSCRIGYAIFSLWNSSSAKELISFLIELFSLKSRSFSCCWIASAEQDVDDPASSLECSPQGSFVSPKADWGFP